MLATDSDPHSEPHSVFEPGVTDSHSESESEQHSTLKSWTADSHPEPYLEPDSMFYLSAG